MGVKELEGLLLFLTYFFADDCLLYFRANALESCVVKQILRKYGLALGQRINFNKSSISFSHNVNPSLKVQISSILEVSETDDHGMYLGLHLVIGRNRKKGLII